MDLAELGDEAVEALTPLAARRRIRLTARATGAVPAQVDPAAMGRVLRNLLHNAIRHSPDGAEVVLEVEPGGFRVVDEGEGFPDEFRPRAFDRFSRADAARSGDGAGLGLAIARGIVEAHGGTIHIEDGPGGRVAVRLRAG